MTITAINYARSLKGALSEVAESDQERAIGRFLILVKENGDYKKIDEILAKFEMLIEKDSGVVEAVVTVSESDTENLNDLQDKISSKIGKEVKVREIINPDLIGGMKVEIEGKVWDNTIKGRLESLKKKLEAI